MKATEKLMEVTNTMSEWYQMAQPRREINIGDSFNNWKVIEVVGEEQYLCECKCNKHTRQILSRVYLTMGFSMSCGCTSEEPLLAEIEKSSYQVKSVSENSDGRHRREADTEDLKGQVFGFWEVVERAPAEVEAMNRNKTMWLCSCICKKVQKYISVSDLKKGKTRSCGCMRKKMIRDKWDAKREELQHIGKVEDLEGKCFGRWKVIEWDNNGRWLCKCQCDKKTMRHIFSYDLTHGKTTSCGCLNDTSFKDMRGQRIGIWDIVEYEGSSKFVCRCSKCGFEKVMDSAVIRSNPLETCDKCMDRLSDNLTNKQFGAWKVISRAPKEIEDMHYRETMWLCECKCGTKKYVSGRALKNNRSRSCGCENNKYRSSYEVILDETFPGATHNNRRILNGLELDLLFEEEGIAIEFNGSYWHSNIFKDEMYHQKKSISALNKGIRIIHIFEYEWNNDLMQDKIKRLIDVALKRKECTRINARDCTIKHVNNEEANEFLNKWHIQGWCKSDVKMGLYYNEELVQIMTFGKPRFDKKAQWELVRLCTNGEYTVSGGSEKIFSHFIKDYEVESIISYCDMSKFSGEVYKRLGFQFDKYTKPNYVWVNESLGEVLPRYKTMKHKLVDAGLGIEEETENEIMAGMGYLKIYDCGNAKYIWNNAKEGDIN